MAETQPGTSAVFSPGDNRSGKTIEECEDMIRRSFRTPMVKFLLEHMEKSGCTIGDRFIRAVHCNKQIAGGYVRGGGIMVCSNHMNLQDDVNQVVIHELIHAYDDCRAANLDWANCAHHACSEIRAGHLSGDCHYKRELLRGFLKIRSHEQVRVLRGVAVGYGGVMRRQGVAQEVEGAYPNLGSKECVRRRVLKSVIANPYCSEAAAKDAMEAVWDICYNDTKPFDRAPCNGVRRWPWRTAASGKKIAITGVRSRESAFVVVRGLLAAPPEEAGA
ncbi:hypothetical protein TIFTF001_002829 [Ficus carica]|uniref:Mitochondrial inner membrane protease ATP23 n=1 Tax=Ficus carica TaxID=3494 RepID=A0AA87ZCP4_FICCA|nr:hypothetical protein TIFTF001_002829 [Ficus carica]